MARQNVLQIRLSDSELEQLTKEANGVVVSKYARTKLLNPDVGVRGKYLEQAKSQVEWENTKESNADAIAAKMGVTKDGEILEVPIDLSNVGYVEAGRVESEATPKLKPTIKRKVNQACEVLGHVPVVTEVEGVVKCSRCGARWRI